MDSGQEHCDMFSCLFQRDLHWMVENILIDTDGCTVANCFQISKYWQKQLQNGHIWRRLLERRFATDDNFRLFCTTNGWMEFFPSQGGKTLDEKAYRQMFYKATCYQRFWSSQDPRSSKLLTGGLFSCLALSDKFLFCGMMDGLIKMWNLKEQEKTKRAHRVFCGHEERVTSMDALDNILVSGSMDQSIRVWDVQTNGMLRVLRGLSSGVLLVRLFGDRIVSWYRSGVMAVWNRGMNADHISQICQVNLHKDTSVVNLVVGEQYVCMAPHDVYINNEREVAVYCSKTGTRLHKDICASFPVQCMDIQGHLLFIGAGCTVEVWDVRSSRCLTVLGSNLRSSPSFYVRSLCTSDFMLVVMYSSGEMLHWQIQDIIKHPEKGLNLPIHRNLQANATLIKNSEPPWKNMVLKNNRLIFGVEMKFGDIKIFTWSFNQQPEDERSLEEDHSERPTKGTRRMNVRKSHRMEIYGTYRYDKMEMQGTYRYDCKIGCKLCQDAAEDDQPVHELCNYASEENQPVQPYWGRPPGGRDALEESIAPDIYFNNLT